MKITFRELRKKLSDMAQNVPIVEKIHWTDSQKIAREGDRKHMTRCNLNKQSLDKHAINHAF